MFNSSFPRYLWCLPAIILVVIIYPIGINLTVGSGAYEIDGPDITMQLDDISKGFARDNPTRNFEIFHSMVAGSVYVPYIWARTSILPPYDLKALDAKAPSLRSELVILCRLMNIIAALGILIIAFYLLCLLTKGYLPPLLTSLGIAVNPNLMFQSNVLYYENWSVFWVMLSALCFVKVILNKKNALLWLSGFFIMASFAVSSHERMYGYYVFTAPFLLYKFYRNGLADKKPHRMLILYILTALAVGLTAFCMANNVFQYGFRPVIEYVKFKSMGINTSSDRMNGLTGLLNNQIRCQAHALWLAFWNSGTILPFFSLYGAAAIWRKRFYPALAVLLFPIGYQVLSVGLPGWTSGRYVLGQTIFVVVFAGFGIAYLTDRAKNRNIANAALALFIAALISESFIMCMAKIANTYYHPYRVIESIARDPSSRGKKIVVQGFTYSKDELCRRYDVRCEVVSEGEKDCPDADIIVSTDKDTLSCGRVRREELRVPPAWLVFLVKRQCYLYTKGASAVRIQWCDNG